MLAKNVFRDDVLALGGLDDRMSRGGYLGAAEDLMAEAVGAQTAFFSTCGSSLSVKAAMMAVAGGSGGGLLGRDSHESVVAGLILSGCAATVGLAAVGCRQSLHRAMQNGRPAPAFIEFQQTDAQLGPVGGLDAGHPGDAAGEQFGQAEGEARHAERRCRR